MIELCEATEDNPFIHGMSKQFVLALQQLFDVMDTDNTGTIRYVDLATQWEEDENDPYLPKGLVVCLAKVTLPSGLLTFDRFCAGIKLCLLKNQVEINETKTEDQDNSSATINNESSQAEEHVESLTVRPSSEPQIYAPSPPINPLSLPHPNSTLSQPTDNEVNNNATISKLSTLSYSNHNNSAINNNNNISTTNSANLSDDSISKSKKLPLPSYEQVMAAKSKSMSKLSFDKISLSRNYQSFNDEGFDSKPNSTNQRINSMYNCKPTNEERQLNVYENFRLFNDNTRYYQENYSNRAKSMTHLDNLAFSPFAAETDTAQNCSKINSTVTVPEHETLNGDSNKLVKSNNADSNISKISIQPKTLSRNCIMKTLQNWRDNIMNTKQVNDFADLTIKSATEIEINKQKVTPADNDNNKSLSININNCANETLNGVNASSLKRNIIKRREPRRHTVGANGVDLYSIKRFQQLEQEKEILICGLNEIEKTKDWYMRQVASIQEKINFAGRSGTFPSDCNIDAFQERINFQAARIQNLNQHLGALREGGQNFPMHMNLAIRPLNVSAQVIDPNQPKQLVVNPNLVNKLKEQNRMLTEEVGRKSERITQLEREKSSLIRELFQARTYSSYYNGDFDDTFM